MKFILFFNDHPKVQAFQMRTWDTDSTFFNFGSKMMTHTDFILHYKIKQDSVLALGVANFNEKTQKWEINKSNYLCFLFRPSFEKKVPYLDTAFHKDPRFKDLAPEDRLEKAFDICLTEINQQYGPNGKNERWEEAQKCSLREQNAIRYNRLMRSGSRQ